MTRGYIQCLLCQTRRKHPLVYKGLNNTNDVTMEISLWDVSSEHCRLFDHLKTSELVK